MKTRIAILLPLLFVAITVHASAWTLDSCVNYAIEHNIDIKLRGADAESSRLQITQAKSRYLPTLSGYANQSWNIGRGLTSQNTYAEDRKSTRLNSSH